MEDIKKQIASNVVEEELTEEQRAISEYVFEHLMETPHTDYDIAVALEAVAQRFFECHDMDMADMEAYGEAEEA